VRDLVKGLGPVRGTDAPARPLLFVESFDLRGNVEEALRSKKEAGSRPRWIPDQAEMLCQFRQVTLGVKVEVDRAAFGVESGGHRQALDERGFSAAVLSDEDRHARVERKRLHVAHRRKVQGISLSFVDRDGYLERPDVCACAGGPLRLAADDHVFRTQLPKTVADLKAMISAADAGNQQGILDASNAFLDDMGLVLGALTHINPSVEHV
jgi:hypothetical protein